MQTFIRLLTYNQSDLPANRCLRKINPKFVLRKYRAASFKLAKAAPSVYVRRSFFSEGGGFAPSVRVRRSLFGEGGVKMGRDI